MVTKLEIDKQSLYEADYLKWIETTVEKLRSQDFSNVDWENLIEEIESMGRSERKSLKSNLIVILIHLLKWQFQPELRSRSWKSSIFEHRRRIHEDIEDSPSLKPYLEEVFAKCYSNAVQGASIETGLPLEVFPQLCPYTSIEVLDSNFLPDDNAQ
ncbi:DUF29 domain-containing protein [Phormidium nigroviride]